MAGHNPVVPLETRSSYGFHLLNIYTAYLLRKEINEQLKTQVKDVCPILIKGSLEEAENG